MIDPKYTKPVSSVMTIQSETNTLKALQDDSVLYTLCDRDNTGDKKGNYFVSFNLPTAASELGTGSTVSLYFPELQQLNVDQIIVCQIPGSSYSEFIDGRSLTFVVPQSGGSNTVSSHSAVTLISTTYSSDKPLKSETSPLLGDNIVYLFCDTINKPYSGYTVNELGIRTDMSSRTTWEPDTTNYLRRPSAISYGEVKGTSLVNGFNTDTRDVVNYSVQVPSNYPENRAGYNYDIPVGFAVLDKGFIVITHTGITSNFPWTLGKKYVLNTASSDVNTLSAKTNIYFTGTTNGTDKSSLLTFTDINTSFKTSAVCLAMPKEFYISNNHTWNREKALTEMNSQTGIISLDPVWITEIGLFNALGESVAVAKLSEPVQKTFINLMTFNIDIET
jgi:hypothetical protein